MSDSKASIGIVEHDITGIERRIERIQKHAGPVKRGTAAAHAGNPAPSLVRLFRLRGFARLRAIVYGWTPLAFTRCRWLQCEPGRLGR